MPQDHQPDFQNYMAEFRYRAALAWAQYRQIRVKIEALNNYNTQASAHLKIASEHAERVKKR